MPSFSYGFFLNLLTNLYFAGVYQLQFLCVVCLSCPGRGGELTYIHMGQKDKDGYYYYAPRPAEQSKAGQGAFYFLAHSGLYKVTTVVLFKVNMFTAHIISIGSHFLTARVLVY